MLRALQRTIKIMSGQDPALEFFKRTYHAGDVDRDLSTLRLQDGTDASDANAVLLERAAGHFAPLSRTEEVEAKQWLASSTMIDRSFLSTLNVHLQPRNYLLGLKYSVADMAVFARLQPTLRQWTRQDIHEFPHVTRWFDFLQHQPQVKVEKKEVIPIDIDAAQPANGTIAARPEKPQKSDAPEGQKKEKPRKAPKAPPKTEQPLVSAIDLRVGHIQKAIKHPDADSLYVSTIDIGEAEPRTICSGLVTHVPLEDMQNRRVVVVANLKPVKMRGIVSAGMVLCSCEENGKVEMTVPPADAKAGDRLCFEGFKGPAESVLNPKKKIWEAFQPGFTTTEELTVGWKDADGALHLLKLEGTGSPVTTPSLVGAIVR